MWAHRPRDSDRCRGYSRSLTQSTKRSKAAYTSVLCLLFMRCRPVIWWLLSLSLCRLSLASCSCLCCWCACTCVFVCMSVPTRVVSLFLQPAPRALTQPGTYQPIRLCVRRVCCLSSLYSTSQSCTACATSSNRCEGTVFRASTH